MIRGTTSLIAHIGYPTHSFKSSMIYNPYFERAGMDAVVVPMGCKAEDYPALLKSIFTLTNIRGALITMPHKVTTVGLLDEVTSAVKIAGSCNAVRRCAAGQLQGDLFDGEGFVRGVRRKGSKAEGAPARGLSLFDARAESAVSLGQRLAAHYPALQVATGSNDPSGHDLVVNATPLGMNDGDPLPMNAARISPATFVGEVVMRQEMTPFLKAVQARGCQLQVGTDMLFEQVPAYLEFFGFPSTTPEVLRSVAKLS